MSLGEHILVVEDDDDIRDVLQYVLTNEGFLVLVARDGIEALDKLEVAGKPAVILLDLMMPNMDGETFLRALRGRPDLAGAPVVIISGHHGAREKAKALNAVACLVKPFELDEMLVLIRRLALNQGP